MSHTKSRWILCGKAKLSCIVEYCVFPPKIMWHVCYYTGINLFIVSETSVFMICTIHVFEQIPDHVCLPNQWPVMWISRFHKKISPPPRSDPSYSRCALLELWRVRAKSLQAPHHFRSQGNNVKTSITCVETVFFNYYFFSGLYYFLLHCNNQFMSHILYIIYSL